MATKNGKTIHSEGMAYKFDSLADAGLVRVTGCDGKHVYFEWTCDLGHVRNGFAKV